MELKRTGVNYASDSADFYICNRRFQPASKEMVECPGWYISARSFDNIPQELLFNESGFFSNQAEVLTGGAEHRTKIFGTLEHATRALTKCYNLLDKLVETPEENTGSRIGSID